MGRTGGLAEQHDAVVRIAHELVLLEVRGHVIAVVLDNEVDLATGDTAVGIHLVPVRLLRIDDLDHKRSEGTAQVRYRPDTDRVFGDTGAVLDLGLIAAACDSHDRQGQPDGQHSEQVLHWVAFSLFRCD